MQKIISFIFPLLPLKKVTIVTRLKEKEIIEILNENIETDFFILTKNRYVDDLKTYQGKIKGNSFKIKTIDLFNTRVDPIVHGKIEYNLDFSKIQILMRLSIIQLIFWGVYLLVIIFGVFNFLIFCFRMEIFISQMLVPFLILCLVYSVLLFFFKRNCKEIETHFKSLFEI